MHVSLVRAGSGVPLLVLAGVLWGTGGLLGQALAASSGLPAVAVAAVRLGGGGLLLCGYLIATGRRLPGTRPARVRVLALGALAALFQAAYFLAVATTSVSLATLVAIGVAPLVVLTVEALRRRQIGARGAGTAALALAGLTLLVGPGAGPVGPGVVFAAVAGAGFGVMTLLSARPVAGLETSTSTGVAFLLGGAMLAPLAWVTAPAGTTVTVTGTAVLLACAFILVPTAVAYTAFFAGLRCAPAGVGAVLALLEPLTAALLAAVLLGERLGPVGWTGAPCCAWRWRARLWTPAPAAFTDERPALPRGPPGGP